MQGRSNQLIGKANSQYKQNTEYKNGTEKIWVPF
uniref:Uncharacterized protein n=1 Tax=Arundo donax TaxID=35708 RepID=A0A0A8Y4N1_ARUDO